MDDPYSYKYELSDSYGPNVDPFVVKALKKLFPSIYEMCKGYTKSINLKVGLKGMLNFA